MLAPVVSVPLVSAKVPATVVAEPRVTPPAPLMVRLLTLPEKTEAGKVKPVPLVKFSVALPLLASIIPLVLVTEAPE